MNAAETVVRIERTIAAPPHKVYRAWLDPQIVQRWLAPCGLTVSRADIDERVGGRYAIWQAQGDGDAGGFECQLLELVPNERIVFQWGFVGPNRTDGPTFDSLLTISLRGAAGNSTVLTLVHERLDALAAAMPDVAKNVHRGWELVLDNLAGTALV